MKNLNKNGKDHVFSNNKNVEYCIYFKFKDKNLLKCNNYTLFRKYKVLQNREKKLKLINGKTNNKIYNEYFTIIYKKNNFNNIISI